MATPTWKRAIEVTRDEGPAGLVRRLRGRGGGSYGGNPFQLKREASLDERWARIDGVLPDTCRSVLDIACNLGDITALAARRGMFSIGVDVDHRWTAGARERHGELARCGFLTMPIDPDTVGSIPTFDAMLCLSVHHNWVNHYGVDAGVAMLRELVERTNQVFVFEGAARRERYGANPPDFVDNDEASVTGFYERYLQDSVGDLVSRIEPMGKTANHEPEPYRWAWALHR